MAEDSHLTLQSANLRRDAMRMDASLIHNTPQMSILEGQEHNDSK